MQYYLETDKELKNCITKNYINTHVLNYDSLYVYLHLDIDIGWDTCVYMYTRQNSELIKLSENSIL